METRHAFGMLFVGVAAAVFSGAVLSELAFLYGASIYYYVAIWLGSFSAAFGIAWPKFKSAVPAIRGRMKNSVRWSFGAKAINAVCWAGPFASIIVFPTLYQYLILAGIGLGNIATYLMMRRYSGLDNREQFVVAIISLGALPIAFIIDVSILAERQDIAVLFSRLFISLSYGAGGAYALLTKR